MKIERFFESNFDEYNKLSDTAKLLFDEIFDEKLLVGKLKIISTFDTGDIIIYKLYCTLYAVIKNETYNDFKLLLDIFNNNDIVFTLDKNELRANIIDINTFINELEILKNSKKFNI